MSTSPSLSSPVPLRRGLSVSQLLNLPQAPTPTRHKRANANANERDGALPGKEKAKAAIECARELGLCAPVALASPIALRLPAPIMPDISLSVAAGAATAAAAPVKPVQASASASAALTTRHQTCDEQCETMHVKKSFPDNSKYDGDICVTHNKKHGRGTFINRHGHIYSGEWKDDCRWGSGHYVWTNQNMTYTGTWRNGYMDGHGLFRWTSKGEQYLGQWKYGRMCGIGTKTMANNDSYTGMWKNDRPNGMGCKIFACGDRHEGEYRDDRRHGHGVYYWQSGERYEGNWVNGRMHGQGIKTMRNGDKYEGAWVHDRAEGFGVKTFAEGDRHEGEYRKDLRHGYGVYYWVTGDRFEGVWINGEQEGTGTYYYSNGDVFKGKWHAGKKHGRGIFTSDSSSWLEVWENGVRMERNECKFYPPRLLRTLKEDGTPAMNGSEEARAIRQQIERLHARLTHIQQGAQWQQHVQSHAFNSLVSRSTAALLSPPQQQQQGNSNSYADIEGIPSPAADIEAAAMEDQQSSSDTAHSTRNHNGNISVTLSAVPNAPSESSTSTSPVNGCEADSSAFRPISPLTASLPSSSCTPVEAAMPASAGESIAAAGLARRPQSRATTPNVQMTSDADGNTAMSVAPSRSPSPANIPDEQLCKVCFIAEINTVLLPCAHVAVCVECSTQLQKCCICRAEIHDAIQTFRA